MVHDCWLVLSELFLQALSTSRGPDGGLRVAPDHGSLTGGDRAYGSCAGRPGTASWYGAACSGYRSRWASGCGPDQAAAASRGSTDVSSMGRGLQQLRQQGPAQWIAGQQGGAHGGGGSTAACMLRTRSSSTCRPCSTDAASASRLCNSCLAS